MDLSTTFLGFELKNPIVPGASPLIESADAARRLEDAGAAALVLHSLFEEEILREVGAQLAAEAHTESFAEALTYLPDLHQHLGPGQYLELVGRIKEAVAVPVIASLNGSTPGGWTSYAKKIEQAGADALELNIFFVATDPSETGQQVEDRTVDVVREVKGAVSIPVAVKLSPFYSSFVNLAGRLKEAGADGLVLFNRFYQPDIDIEELAITPNLRLSTSDELRLRLRQLALLSGRVDLSLAATGGVHSAVDVIKAVMAGADVVQIVSALLIHGAEHITRTLHALEFWLEEHEYESLRQMRGSMSLARTPNPAALGRANYMQVLEDWRQ